MPSIVVRRRIDMVWQPGKSYYENVVERALIQLAASSVLCSDYRFNRSTWFSDRLRYDFVLGASLPSTCLSPHLIEVHGDQHYRYGGHWSDAKKKRLALEHGCPFLVIPYRDAYRVSDELLDTIQRFVEQR